MSTIKYHLVVENGEVIKEEGYLYKAGPFELLIDGTTLQSSFKRTPDHKVIYEITSDEKSLLKLQHPDYTPEGSPQDQTLLIQKVIGGFFKVEISKGKAWREHLATLDPQPSFEIKQFEFL